ncbi:MAG: hypothetical protein MUF58_23275 [Arcicella sp.]|jgi:hypothetical protein|nr:hypothetical protein [Arcicella sp.]
MESTVNLNIPLTINELAVILRKQLPQQDRIALANLLQEDDISVEQLKIEIRQAVKEINLVKKGKLTARPVQDLLDEL